MRDLSRRAKRARKAADPAASPWLPGFATGRSVLHEPRPDIPRLLHEMARIPSRRRKPTFLWQVCANAGSQVSTIRRLESDRALEGSHEKRPSRSATIALAGPAIQRAARFCVAPCARADAAGCSLICRPLVLPPRLEWIWRRRFRRRGKSPDSLPRGVARTRPEPGCGRFLAPWRDFWWRGRVVRD